MFLVKAAFWLIRTAVTLTLTVIPLAGLVALVLAVVYRPEELATVVRGLITQEYETGSEDEDPPVPLVA